VLLSLIPLGSSIAFLDIVNLSIACLYSSYLLTCALLLRTRLVGGVGVSHDSTRAIRPGQLYWGPWRIPELLGTINNTLACFYLSFVLFWSFWLALSEVTPATVNYNILVFGAVVLFEMLWYILRARRYYNVPMIEVGPA
jgi:amino acid transporter